MSKTLYPNSIRIGLMDPSIAQTWAQRILSDGTTVGSIKKGDTINHTTSQPIATGLFCQRIFGPCIDYTCACGHEKIRLGFNANIAPPVCSECHVEWTHASVRRQFLGSIDLISPVTHKWFSDSRGAYIPTLLGITPRTFRNLKECKLFFPFGLKKSQESMQYLKQKKKINDITDAATTPPIGCKDVAPTLRAMHTLQFLIDPQKSSSHFLQNLQLTRNLRGFWFLSNKLLESGNISRENLFSKFSDVCIPAGATYFPSTVLGPLVEHETSSKYSIATKTFEKEISFQNPQNAYNKAFSPFQTQTQRFLSEKKRCSKDKNFFSVIAATQWLTIEQAFSVKKRITEVFSKKGKKPVKSLFSSKQNSQEHFFQFEENTNNPLNLELPLRQVKNQNLNVLAGGHPHSKTSLWPLITIESKGLEGRLEAIPVPMQSSQKSYPWAKASEFAQSFKKLNGIKSLSFKNDDIIFDWKAKSLLSETTREQKKIPTTNLPATLGPKNPQDNFLKKVNLKYVFGLAQTMENNNSSVFSKSFSILALQNKQVSLKYKLQVKTVLNTKEKKTVLASFFEDVRKIKSQNQASSSKREMNAFSVLGINGTYIFRDFTKYKFQDIPEILFGKNERSTQLFALHSTNRTTFGKKIQNFKRIGNYKIGLLGNSKARLSMNLSPFSKNLLFKQKNPWSSAETTFKRIFVQSTSKWLLSKDLERLFSFLQCSSLLRTTRTKLWYLQKKKTLASFALKTNFYGYKNVKPFCPKSIYLVNLLYNKPLNPFQKDRSNFTRTVFKNANSFAKHHNFPIRPSYTQPEDYRRQFIKFLGHNSLIQNTDVPIFRYIQTKLTNKGQIIENLVKQPFTQKAGGSFLSAQAIEVYFSEAKSYAKEQTIKKILSQTGGGGLQTYLELVNLSELVLILQNDLIEIAPRLAKSQSTRRVLLSIINDASNSLSEAFALLRKSTNKNNSVLASAYQDELFSSNPMFNKKQEKYSIGPLKELEDQEKSVPVSSNTVLLKNNLYTDANAKHSQKSELTGAKPDLSTGETKETNYPNHLLLGEKIEVLEKKCKDVKKEYKAVKKICNDFQNRKNAHKRRYKLAFQLLRTMSNPAGMTMSSVPVLPPGLRPIIDVPKIGPITADLNIRYRSLLFALRNLRELAYVDFRNAGAAQASVQEAVDDLLYTGGKTRREKPSSQNPNLYKSLAMRLKGKHGRFRGNLLGKRVDYSGRSVIVVGPTLKIHQCGLPFEIAIKLFNPFLIRSLIQRGFCKNVYKAKQILIRGKFKPLIWTLCQEVMSEHLVLLNRAPTLHRLGVQAFMPVLISGRAILLHPLVCTGFNADFDGDQMGVHVPLFPQARAEAWKMMWSRNNFLLPSSGEPVLLPSQDMVLGCYYLTCSTQKVLQTTLVSKCNDSLSFPFTILNKKTALNGYNKGTYNIQSIVWINPNKTTFLKSYRSFQRYNKNPISIKSWNPKIQRIEDDGLVTPTLELRITPFGIMRLLYTSGIKSFTFQNSLLLPGRQAVKPPVFVVFVRTTIGRLIFNNLLEDISFS